MLGGRLIETVGDGGPRLMIEHDRTRLTDPRYFFILLTYEDEVI